MTKKTNSIEHFTRSDLGPQKSFESFINQCKERFPYSLNEWDSNTWNLTEYEKKKIGSRAKQYRLIFGLTHGRSGPKIAPQYFSQNWNDLVKGMLSVRFLERGVGFGPQQTILLAFRYLYQVVSISNTSLEDLQNRHFVEASELLQSRESPSTCYRIGNSLELISKLIDRFYLAKVKTSFTSSFKRTAEYDPLSERTIERSSKLQLSERAVEGIVELDSLVTSPDEKLIVESLKLLLFTGLRISELFALERNCLLIKVENGEEFVGIRYYPLKGGDKTTRIKWFGDLSGKLVKSTIYEIQKLTLEAHEAAKWLKLHPHQSYLRILFKTSEVTVYDLMELLGTESKSAAYSILNKAKIVPPYKIEKFDELFRPNEDDLIPFKDEKTGYELHLANALFVTFRDTYSLGKHQKKYLPEILKEGSLDLVIKGKEDKKYPRPSIFEKYELKDEAGEKIHITGHMFRRLLNTIYNEGGVPLTILTKIFGRKNPKDTLSYLYTTPKKRTEDARKLFVEGSLIGPKASIMKKIPILKREEFANSLIESVHHLGFGFCCHDWSTLPCEKHLQCLDNCVDFHMDKNDSKTKEYLLDQKEKAKESLEVARKEVEEGTYGASAQADHYQRVLESASRYLRELENEEK